VGLAVGGLGIFPNLWDKFCYFPTITQLLVPASSLILGVIFFGMPSGLGLIIVLSLGSKGF
jgi:hypothetical protein